MIFYSSVNRPRVVSGRQFFWERRLTKQQRKAYAWSEDGRSFWDLKNAGRVARRKFWLWIFSKFSVSTETQNIFNFGPKSQNIFRAQWKNILNGRERQNKGRTQSKHRSSTTCFFISFFFGKINLIMFSELGETIAQKMRPFFCLAKKYPLIFYHMTIDRLT